MNKENTGKLWRLIQEAGDYLKGQLPDHPNHPKGRNPYAHVAICVKNKFNASYKDIPNDKYNEVLEYIDFLKKIQINILLFWKIIFQGTFSIYVSSTAMQTTPKSISIPKINW